MNIFLQEWPCQEIGATISTKNRGYWLSTMERLQHWPDHYSTWTLWKDLWWKYIWQEKASHKFNSSWSQDILCSRCDGCNPTDYYTLCSWSWSGSPWRESIDKSKVSDGPWRGSDHFGNISSYCPTFGWTNWSSHWISIRRIWRSFLGRNCTYNWIEIQIYVRLPALALPFVPLLVPDDQGYNPSCSGLTRIGKGKFRPEFKVYGLYAWKGATSALPEDEGTRQAALGKGLHGHCVVISHLDWRFTIMP